MLIVDVLDKCKRVLESCESIHQIPMASRYSVRLFNKHIGWNSVYARIFNQWLADTIHRLQPTKETK